MVDLQLTGAAPAGGNGPVGAGAAPAAPGATGAAGHGPLDAAAARARPAAGPLAPSDGALKAAVKDANQALAAIGTQLVFVFDDQSHHLAVKLLDVQTQKVVQQIPSAAMPATASALAASSASGALVDTKA